MALLAKVFDPNTGGVFKRPYPSTCACVSLITYTPVMHGLIRYVPEQRCTSVIGWANWFVLVFAAVTVWASREMSELRFLGYFAVIFLVIYVWQVVRYSSVARMLASGQLGP